SQGYRSVDVEGNPLGQWQCLGIIDGVCGAAHIGLPGIRAGFAAAARFLFAAESAADFSA
ncbi:hypothetical protein NY486_03725, partial [Enterobacter hormaechei]|nr:hypothetical protein [Enterobacter hormaechei]